MLVLPAEGGTGTYERRLACCCVSPMMLPGVCTVEHYSPAALLVMLGLGEVPGSPVVYKQKQWCCKYMQGDDSCCACTEAHSTCFVFMICASRSHQPVNTPRRMLLHGRGVELLVQGLFGEATVLLWPDANDSALLYLQAISALLNTAVRIGPGSNTLRRTTAVAEDVCG